MLCCGQSKYHRKRKSLSSLVPEIFKGTSVTPLAARTSGKAERVEQLHELEPPTTFTTFEVLFLTLITYVQVEIIFFLLVAVEFGRSTTLLHIEKVTGCRPTLEYLNRCFNVRKGLWRRLALRACNCLVLVVVPLLLAPLTGCSETSSQAFIVSQPTNSNSSLKALHYNGGFVFADHEHIVGIDVAKWGLVSRSQVQKIETSCECVRASLKEVGDGSQRIILVVLVGADSNLSRNVTLAVRIEATLSDDSKKVLSFDFTHVAIPTANERTNSHVRTTNL